MTTIAATFAQELKKLGIRYIFGIPSGNWVDYMEAIRETEGLEFTLVSHEGAAGFMADVCWRLTGQVAACFGTFGPGACNLSTGVCGAYLDRSPMLVFTDEMAETMRPRICQMNIDHQALFKPITKWTTRIADSTIASTLNRAFSTAVSEVPGPVHIGLPAGMGNREALPETSVVAAAAVIEPPARAALEEMAGLFASSRKPIIALGITALRAGVREAILELMHTCGIPAVLTPMAKGLVPDDNPLFAGVLAHALGDLVGSIHQQADLVLGVGYDPVEINYEEWIPDVPVVHLDTRPADLDRQRFTLCCDVVGDIKTSLQFLLAKNFPRKKWDPRELAQNRDRIKHLLKPPAGVFGARKVLDELQACLPKDSIMTCDVGAHLHLIGQQWKTWSPECQLMTNGCSSMGFAVPAAIAAKLVMPERTVCCVTGDGGFSMMAGEMVTARRLGLNCVFIQIIDSYLSLIRIKQEKKGYHRYGTDLVGSNGSGPWSNRIFGVPVVSANNTADYRLALQSAFAAAGPVVVEAHVDTNEYDELVLRGNK